MAGQLSLFGPPPPPVGARVSAEDRALAARLPPGLRLGTSSWTFPGWSGVLYDREVREEVLAHHGLRAYAEHPLFRTVGVDRSHYEPLPIPVWQAMREQVPPDFRFMVKAHEACTLARWPDHPRYGRNRGLANPLFLDPIYAADAVVGPTVEGLAGALGVLLFQFAPQDLEPLGGPGGFCDRLHRFLSALPRGPLYGVEVRNPSILGVRYAAALAEVGAVPSLVSTPGMPNLEAQLRTTNAPVAPLRLVRWMLRRDLDYATAKARFSPFRERSAPDPEALAQVLKVLGGAGDAIVIVNNKAEGCSPESVRAIARGL